MKAKTYRRLLEYSYVEFSRISRKATKKPDKGNEHWKYARMGFLLGVQESLGRDGLLTSYPSSYTDVDFIKVIFENLKDAEENLIEKLTYFLCGYDKFKICERDAKENKPKIKLNNFYDTCMQNLNNSNYGTSISVEDLNEKRVFVENIIINS